MSDSMSTDIGLVPDRTTPLERSRRRWSLGCIFIVQALHGVAFYAMSSSLMAIAKTHLNFSNTAAVGTSLAFSACVYVMPSVGGTVGDIQLGRYKTIFYGIALYLLGTVLSLVLVILLNVSKTTPIDVLPMRIVYICSLILVAVSRGFIKTNIIPFGAQQVDQSKSFHITSYFRWSIWFFNIGKFCAYCPLAFFVLNVGITDGLLIQAIVQVVTVGLSVAVFILGKGKYTVSHHVSPPSTGRASIKYLWEVVRSSLSCFKKRQPWDDDTSWTESAETVTKEEKAITRIVFKKICFMLGIFASIGVFETLYFQMTSTYIMQGKSLRHDMEILPKQLMNAFAPCVVLVGVPLTEFVSRKCWSRERRKYKFTELMQMGSGTIFAALSVLCAGIIESAIRTGWDVNVFWQMPQFTLMGMADLLVFIPGFEFCYRESMAGLASFTTGLFFAVGSLFGFIIFLAFIPLGTIQVGEQLNEKYFEYLFYVLFGLMVVVLLVIFLPLSHWYTGLRRELLNKEQERARGMEVTIQQVRPQDEGGES